MFLRLVQALPDGRQGHRQRVFVGAPAEIDAVDGYPESALEAVTPRVTVSQLQSGAVAQQPSGFAEIRLLRVETPAHRSPPSHPVVDHSGERGQTIASGSRRRVKRTQGELKQQQGVHGTSLRQVPSS